MDDNNNYLNACIFFTHIYEVFSYSFVKTLMTPYLNKGYVLYVGIPACSCFTACTGWQKRRACETSHATWKHLPKPASSCQENRI